MKKHIKLVIFTMMVFTIIGCKKSKSEAGKNIPSFNNLQNLDILIDWQAEPTYLGVYFAKELGLFEKLGFDVNIIQSWGANEVTSVIAVGKYKIGTASAGATAIAKSNGANLISMAVLYHNIPTTVFGLKGIGIASPQDLEGKTVGVYPKSITKNEFEGFLKLNKIDRNKIKLVSINGPDIPLILSQKVDAVLNYFELSPTLLSLEKETFDIRLADYGVNAYGLNIISSRDTYNQEPDLVQNLTDAIINGYKEGCENQKAAVNAFLDEFPEKDSNYVEISWEEVCKFINNDYQSQTVDGWQQTIDFYNDSGLLTKPVSPKELMP